jgi:hypothetical protein
MPLNMEIILPPFPLRHHGLNRNIVDSGEFKKANKKTSIIIVVRLHE